MQLHSRRASRGFNAVGALAAAAGLIILWAGPAHAQSPTARRDERRTEMEARQRALHTLSERASRPKRKEPDTRPSYQQVAEDFQQLQLRNYNLSGALEPGARFDYGQIREEAAEVRRRASRLKETLALPAVKRDQKEKKAGETLTPEEMKAAITSLDGLVRSFVWNPVFQRPDVLDAENSAKAGRELEEILRLSEQIREAAEALGKRKGSQ